MMDAREIIERIMSAHSDLESCPCWVCRAGIELEYCCRYKYRPYYKDNDREFPVPYPCHFVESEAVAFGKKMRAAEVKAAKGVATTIKAELYDLQSHTCTGRLTVFPDGQCDPNDRQCPTCARVKELQNQLKKLIKKIGDE